MLFSEKLQLLREQYGYSQEVLAEKCNVSRQAISKWELGNCIPDVDKLLLLSKNFKVSLDYLLKEDIDEINTNSCGCYGQGESDSKEYNGIIIKESLGNELILDLVKIEKVEIWKTQDIPKYWTAVYFTSNYNDFPYILSKALTGKWFVDMKINNTKIIVFKDKVLQYEIGNYEEKELVKQGCRDMGIPERQINWPE